MKYNKVQEYISSVSYFFDLSCNDESSIYQLLFPAMLYLVSTDFENLGELGYIDLLKHTSRMT